jgi:hypothetical protein
MTYRFPRLGVLFLVSSAFVTCNTLTAQAGAPDTPKLTRAAYTFNWLQTRTGGTQNSATDSTGVERIVSANQYVCSPAGFGHHSYCSTR